MVAADVAPVSVGERADHETRRDLIVATALYGAEPAPAAGCRVEGILSPGKEKLRVVLGEHAVAAADADVAAGPGVDRRRRRQCLVDRPCKIGRKCRASVERDKCDAAE